MPSSPDHPRIKRLWRRLAGDSNKQVAADDTPVNSAAATGNTPQPSPAAAGIAFPPLLIVPGSPGYAALALMLVPVTLWVFVVWMSTRGSSKSR
ncbi:hypothetical protein ACFRFL_44030 [Streptomyces sp. NPDC056708]|uniref:hypothetical protein n=1 Tax=unclassified Streptomyces TaxID=2593676 RepID=UPI003683E27E